MAFPIPLIGLPFLAKLHASWRAIFVECISRSF
jgi:hypothetical protein